MLKSCCIYLSYDFSFRCFSWHLLFCGCDDEPVPASVSAGAFPHCRWNRRMSALSSTCPGNADVIHALHIIEKPASISKQKPFVDVLWYVWILIYPSILQVVERNFLLFLIISQEEFQSKTVVCVLFYLWNILHLVRCVFYTNTHIKDT